jgi:hypothetical protein
MFNLSTLSGINLQTDNYFQYTSVSTKAPLCFNQNSLAFYLERKGVLKRMQRKFFRKKKLHRKALLKDFTMQLF